MATTDLDLSLSVPAPDPSARTERERVLAQVAAIEAWHAASRSLSRAEELSTQALATVARTREMRMDRDRRMAVLRRQHEAMIARTQQRLVDGGRVSWRSSSPTAVVAHRDPWFGDRVVDGLTSAGIEVIARTPNGADAVGIVVAEQPDLLLLTDRLEMLPGADVLRESLRFAPALLAATQVDAQADIPQALDAGARLAFTRRVPPAEVVAELTRLVRG